MFLPPSPSHPTHVLRFPNFRSISFAKISFIQRKCERKQKFSFISRTFLLKFLTKIEKFVRNFHEIRLNFRPFVHNIIFSQKYKYKPNDLDKFIKYFKSNSIKFNIYFVNINLQTIVSLSQSFLS